jgi:hypothetical protein
MTPFLSSKSSRKVGFSRVLSGVLKSAVKPAIGPDLLVGFIPVIILSLAIATTSCVKTLSQEIKFGINPSRAGYIPARIALAPCIQWPDRATKILGLPLINRPKNELDAICLELNKLMADGFDNQPFMKGLSQKLTAKLYTGTSQVLSLSDAIAQEWRALPSDCQNCSNLPSLYTTSIKGRASWQIWLNSFSNLTKSADAILIPVVLSLNTRDGDDRGVLQSIRSGAVAMLLIDTNDGSLIWSGAREAEVIHKAFGNMTTREQMKVPPLEDLQRRLFTDAIWLEFPGRQVYR